MSNTPPIAEGVKFLEAIFQPGSRVTIRPIETWKDNAKNGKPPSRVDYKGVEYLLLGSKNGDGQFHHTPDRLKTGLQRVVDRSAQERTNTFFGTCPRLGGGGRFDRAWQIREVPALWADVDNTHDLDVLTKRIESAGLPAPSIIDDSGHGFHLFWLLDTPFKIDDCGNPPPVQREWIKKDRKKSKVEFYVDADGERHNLKCKADDPPLSDKAQWITDILQGIATAIGGDHTHDLARLLRLPGTLNRKNERNGTPPVPCRMVEFHTERKYSIATFEQFAEKSPAKAEREKVSKVKLPKTKKLTPKREDGLNERILLCDTAPQGERSEADFCLICWCVEQGVDRDEVWARVQGVGKFAERGEKYFASTWEKAAGRTREKIWTKATGKHTKGERKPGEANVTRDDPFAANTTDLGNAKRFASQHGSDCRYCHPWGKWLVFDGSRWAIDQSGEVARMAKRTALSIYAEAAHQGDDDCRKSLVEWAGRSESLCRLQAMVTLAQSEDGIPVMPDQLNQHPWLFNCANGTIDLQAGTMQPHQKEDFLTQVSPVVFDPNARAERWERFLDEIFLGDRDLCIFMQRLSGYCLTGSTRDHILPILYGKGSNGKTTLVETMLACWGQDYALKTPADFLMAKRDCHPTEKTDLFGRRFVACVETEDNRRLAESFVKEITGGDRIRARRMREDFWEFAATHKVWLATNHKPRVRGTDEGIWRRNCLIPFRASFDGEKKDDRLPEILLGELPGILAWAVRGCLDWQRIGLDRPQEVQAATTEYRRGEDSIARFIDEACNFAPEESVRATDLLNAYREWAGDSGMSQKRFGDIMTEREFDRTTIGGKVWYLGIGLLPDFVDKK